MNRIPIYDVTEPIACTIDAGEVDDRIAQFGRMRKRLHRIERTEHGLLLHFPNQADIEDDLRRFAIDEKRCCAFWGFAVEPAGDQLVLRWDAPPAAGDLVERVMAYFEGDEPLTAFTGLL